MTNVTPPEHACGTMGETQSGPRRSLATFDEGLGRPNEEVPLMDQGTRPTPRWTGHKPESRDEPPTGANMRFGMPASFEDMVALGFDPYTGERVQ